MGELGMVRETVAFDSAMSEWATTEWAAEHSDPITAMLRHAAEELTGAMVELGSDPARLATVRVCATLREDVAAQMLPFADGSGLVMISDAIVSLTGVYARYAGDAFARVLAGGKVRGLWRAFRATRKGGLGEDPAMLTGQLRYYNVSQRIYGLAAKLIEHQRPDAVPLTAMVQAMALDFIVGHEIAHHALGHDSAPSGFSPGEHLPVCSEDAQRELDADLLAYRASVLALRRESAASGDADAAEVVAGAGVLAAQGALIAMMAVHSTEHALFVRRGTTHPAASVRASLLLEQLPPGDQAFARLYLANLLAATEASSVFEPGATPFAWEWFASSSRLDIPHSDDYLRLIFQLDNGQCQSTATLIRWLGNAGFDESSMVGRGARLAASGQVEAAFSAWCVPTESAERICDRSRALAFHTVLKSLRSAFTEQDVDADATLAVAVCGATIAARALA
ncbi:hypothetical protein [Actinokineospora sp.]|uniref:hypothetical protein n=1 Tax=Actinokineospora sp. TaxID=1872133 RepID=UPI004037654D